MIDQMSIWMQVNSMPVKQTPIFVLCLFASTLAWSQDDVRIVKPSPRVKSDPIVPVGYVVSADNPTPTGRQLAPLRLNLAERDMNHGESLLARFEANEANVLPPAQDTKPAAKPSSAATKTLSEKDVEKLVADALKKKDEEKKKEDEKKKKEAEEEKKKKAEDDKKKKEEDEAKKKKEEEDKRLNELYGGTRYDLYNLYDSLTRPSSSSKKWYEKLSIRGYTQVRFTKTLETDAGSAQPNLFGDRSVNGQSEDFSLRRVRLIFFGDVGDHLGIYIQPDFASTPQGSTNSTFFGQLRDAYGDVYIDKEKVHRIRAGLSKVPYGFENMQSSQNRVALDRTDAINSGVSPNERDLGLFYYWTPVEQQKLFKTLVDSGLKGSGNYGVFGVGVYNGQGGSQFELNDNVHTVARFTYPFQLENAQVVEMSVQGYTGYSVTNGAAIRPLGSGPIITRRTLVVEKAFWISVSRELLFGIHSHLAFKQSGKSVVVPV